MLWAETKHQGSPHPGAPWAGAEGKGKQRKGFYFTPDTGSPTGALLCLGDLGLALTWGAAG